MTQDETFVIVNVDGSSPPTYEETQQQHSNVPIDITVIASEEPFPNSDAHLVLIKVQPPAGLKRTPVDVCCVIDVSGSMASEATMTTETGDKESDGLTILDVVKHSVRTIINNLTDTDRLALVAFSGNATTVLKLTVMNAEGRQQAEAELEKMVPLDCTNLWGGLEMGLDVLKAEQANPTAPCGRMASVLLFTDGIPNVEPPRGHIPMLQQYKDQNNNVLPGIINTFGFGYSLKSALLNELAVEGNGAYSFIPDGSFVGTTFINATANLLSTVATKAKLQVEMKNGAKILSENSDTNGPFQIPGGHPCQSSNWGLTVDLCNLQYGQSKDIILRMTNLPPKGGASSYLSANLTFQTCQDSNENQSRVGALGIHCTSDLLQLQSNLHRLEFVDAIHSAMKVMNEGNRDEALGHIQTLIERIRSSPTTSTPATSALLQDLTGQVTEAFIQKYYNRWGKHYLPSLSRAHQLQICNNFKDPGVQVYGGQLFKELQGTIEKVFLGLPPPKPSNRRRTRAGSLSAPSQPVNMARYYNSSNPCFAGWCSVRMEGGMTKRVDEVKKGDRLEGGGEVVCVLVTKCVGGRAAMVSLGGADNGLLITPWHPVKWGDDSAWTFPADIADAEEVEIDAVYSFLLSEGHTMVVGGIPCVTLAHGFVDNEVVRHAYFGTTNVVGDLMRMTGWDDGRVLSLGVVRGADGLVCGLRQAVGRRICLEDVPVGEIVAVC
ncbi:hypothetical protein HDV00_009855 [Rhizophlyctis rosea]|nr:hypothetical protein HDV00_009855 [Rhizophlyctis rosea]